MERHSPSLMRSHQQSWKLVMRFPNASFFDHLAARCDGDRRVSVLRNLNVAAPSSATDANNPARRDAAAHAAAAVRHTTAAVTAGLCRAATAVDLDSAGQPAALLIAF